MTPITKRGHGNKTSKATREQRALQAVERLNEGATQTQIAEELNISPVTLWRTLKELTVRFQSQNSEAFEEYKRVQLQVFELMERSLIEGSIDTDTAREWRGIRSEISKLLGLNAPTTSVTTNINAEVDPHSLGRYRRFCYETRNLTDAQLERVYEFCRPLNVLPQPKLLEALPPSELEEA